MMILTGKTITSAVRPPYPYGGEFISQFLFALQLCWFPMLISTVAFGFGAPGLQAANFLTLFGALDRLGGFFILASVREFAPFVTAVVVAGVAGTAITADLGARKIREELDALQVLGVDPIKNLVVPRFLSLMLITGLLDIYALLFGITGGIFAELAYGQPLGGFFATLFTNASVTDLWGSVLKSTLFGAIIAIVCSYKGMNASGGAAGVGRAVNEAVVIAFMGVFAFNYVFTQTLLATHPELQTIESSSMSAWLDSSRATGSPRSVRSPASAARVMGLVYSGRVFQLLRRGAAPGRDPDPRLDDRDLGPRLHPRPAVRDRGRLLHALGRRPRLRRRLRRLVRPARGHPLRLRLHDGRQGRHRDRRRARRDADLRRDRRARGDGHPPDHLPLRDPPARPPGWCFPFMYLAAIGVGFLASYLAVVQQIGEVSSGGYFLIFWMFQNPPDLIFSVIKGMVMATAIVLVGCYYGYTASGGPVGVGTATAKSMVLNIVLVHIIGMMGTLVFWGANPRAPIGG